MRSSTRWIRRGQSARSARAVRLFCLPYAGASSSIFNGWEAHLSDRAELCPVLLPGRGVRLSEAPIQDFREMVSMLATGLEPYLHQPFVFFGHSMGALLAHELTLHLEAARMPTPELLVVSGRQAPHLPGQLGDARGLSDEAFIELLDSMNGQTKQLLSDLSLRKVLMPILRADFNLCASWQPGPIAPIDIPIVAFAGAHDRSVSVAMVEQWRLHTTRGFAINVVPGDHFFVHQFAKAICDAVERHIDAQATVFGTSSSKATAM